MSTPGGETVDPYPRWRRRKTLVNREYQLRFSTMLLVQMTTVIVAIGVFAFIESRVTMSMVLRHLSAFPVPSYELHLSNQTFLFKVIAVIAVTALAQVMFGIYASHKFAGPMVKIARLVDRATEGDYSARVRFREGDHLEDLAESINGFVATLSEEQERGRAAMAEVEVGLARVASGEAGEADIERIRQRLAEIAQVEIESPAACGR